MGCIKSFLVDVLSPLKLDLPGANPPPPQICTAIAMPLAVCGLPIKYCGWTDGLALEEGMDEIGVHTSEQGCEFLEEEEEGSGVTPPSHSVAPK